ncbi:MAG: hypothetical protein ACI9BH_002811 [Paracoccaceae bacterium]|jgi:uncharacterized protein YbjT (DUF2867 family)
MKVLVLGATGSIGTAVTKELIGHDHKVIALSRSTESDAKLRDWGAFPFRGDLRKPTQWADMVGDCDGIIQVATTFTDDMGQVDTAVLGALKHRPLIRLPNLNGRTATPSHAGRSSTAMTLQLPIACYWNGPI